MPGLPGAPTHNIDLLLTAVVVLFLLPVGIPLLRRRAQAKRERASDAVEQEQSEPAHR